MGRYGNMPIKLVCLLVYTLVVNIKIVLNFSSQVIF